MARGINKVILVGNLGNDPEVKILPSGDTLANISLATSESWKDKQTGQPVDQTEWHRIVLFKRLAEITRDYLRKGSKVYIEGKLRTRKWKDKEGQDRQTTEIVANDMQMLDSRSASPSSATEPFSSPPAAEQPPPIDAEPAPADDDIPF